MQKIIPFKKETRFKENVSEITSISLEHSLHKEKDNLITGEFLVSGEYKVVDTSSVIDHFSFHLPFDIHLDDKYDISHTEIDIDDFYYEIINNDTLLVNIDVLVDKIEENKVEEEEELVRNVEVMPLEDVFAEAVEEAEKEANPETTREENEEVAEAFTEVEDRESEEDRMEEKIEEPIRLDIEEEVKTEVEPNRNMEIPATVEENIQSIEMREEISSIFDDMGNKGSTTATYRVYIVREEDTLESIMTKYSINKENLEKYNHLNEIKKGDKLIIPCIYSEKI